MSNINLPGELTVGKTHTGPSGRDYKPNPRPPRQAEQSAAAQLAVIRMDSAVLRQRIDAILQKSGPDGIPLKSIYRMLGLGGIKDHRIKPCKALYRVRNALQRLEQGKRAASNGRGLWRAL